MVCAMKKLPFMGTDMDTGVILVGVDTGVVYKDTYHP